MIIFSCRVKSGNTHCWVLETAQISIFDSVSCDAQLLSLRFYLGSACVAVFGRQCARLTSNSSDCADLFRHTNHSEK